MAAVAPSASPCGAREALGSPNPDPQMPGLQRQISRRTEAFVMTGDKILSLTPSISPSYAKLARDQLPPHVNVKDSPPPCMAACDFPSVRRSKIPRMKPSSHESSPVKELPPGGSTLPAEEGDELPPESVGGDEDSQAACSSTTQQPDDKAAASTEQIVEVEPQQRTPSPKREFVDSSMQTSVYVPATSSNPALRDRTQSSSTFILQPESPTKSSAVTVNPGMQTPVHVAAATSSYSETCSPSVKRIPSRASNILYSPCRSDSGTSPVASTARQMFCLNGYTAADVAKQLDQSSDAFEKAVAESYFSLHQFNGLRIDAALRQFLSRVELIGETSQRERLLQHFSRRYFECNPLMFTNFDTVHMLTCAILLLNSDLHGPSNRRKMSRRDFLNNLETTGSEYNVSLLKDLYASIKTTAIVGCNSQSQTTKSKSHQQLAEVDPESQVEYKAGWIMRKWERLANGAKVPFGRRGWTMYYMRLRGLALYLDTKEEKIKFTSHHEAAVRTMREVLEEVRKNAPPLHVKGRVAENYFHKERFLMMEVNRYDAYINVLRDKIIKLGGVSGSTSGVDLKSEFDDDADKRSYRVAMELS